MTGRLVSALVCGEPDLAQRPLRRTPIGLVAGLMAGVLVVAVFAVIAIVHPGGATRWRQPGTLIVDKQTGTRYVLSGGQLRPVLNYASARLLLGAVSRSDPSGVPAPALSLGVGTGPAAEPVPDDHGVLVRTSDGTRYLAWKDRRLRLAAPWAGPALGYDDAAATPVRAAWVNALPAGPDLGPLPVAGRGAAGPDLDGASTAVGQVFVVHGMTAAARYFVLTGAGLLPVNQTGAALLLGDPATATAYGGRTAQARELSPAALASAVVLPAPASMPDLPPAPPALLAAQPQRLPCVRATAAGAASSVALVSVPAGAALGDVVDGPLLDRDGLTADLIGVRPGGGLLARTMPAPGIDGAGLYVVAEPGVKYPVADEVAAQALGYQVSDAVEVPASLLTLLPTGPVLRRLAGPGGEAAAP